MDVDIKGWTELSYEDLKKFLTFYSERYLNIQTVPPEKRPMASLEVLEKTRPKAAAAGLRQAVSDCIEASFHFKSSDVEALDNQLRKLDIVTISELRRIYSKKYKRILSRGYVKDDVEWYLVKNVLNDPTPKPSSETGLLEGMISSYEVS